MIPKFKSFYRPFLELLHEKGPMSKECITKEIAVLMRLSNADKKQTTPSGVNVITQRVHWTTVYMMKAGMIKRIQRGVYGITEKGDSLLETHIGEIDNYVLASVSEDFSKYQYIRKQED